MQILHHHYLSSKVAGNIVDLLMPPFKVNEIIIVYSMAAIIRAFLVGSLTFIMMMPFVNFDSFKLFKFNYF